MYQTIIIATDLDESSHEIVRKSADIARNLQGKIYILHVIEPPASTIYAASLGFAEFTAPATDDAVLVLKTIGDELDIPQERQIVKVGSIKAKVHEVALGLNADLIIIGSHTKKNLTDFLGTTANELIQTAPCDVLTVRHN